jgi:alpha-glucosidase
MRMKSLKCIFLVLFALFSSIAINAKRVEIKSPDGSAVMVIDAGDEVTYSVQYKGEPVVVNGTLALNIKNAVVLGRDVVVTGQTERSVNETWTPVLKRRSLIVNRYNEVVVGFAEKRFPGRKYNIIVRAYNDGVAFRYDFPKGSWGFPALLLHDELTTFPVAGNSVCWAANYGSFTTHQESEFEKQRVADIAPDAVIGLPMLFKTPGNVYAAITEAHLENWAGMYLGAVATNEGTTTLKALLPSRPSDKQERVRVDTRLPAQSPWRVIMLGSTAGALVESEIVMNLNPACAIDDPSWIKPGLCAWDHWWSGDVVMNTKTIKEYIDLAAENGWPYMLIDWQWYGDYNKPDADCTTLHPDVNMDEVRQYAKSKGVKLWLWLYFSDISRQMEEAFALYEEWGIVGVKIDFMARDDQEMVDWYHNTVKLAAKHKLMVNFHGAYKPDGFRRTYPNLMTREGVLGNEYNKWSMRVTPEHNVTLPFTRMLAGPMDYTPGAFINKGIGEFRQQNPTMAMGTRCHELAKFVVYDSPITTVCDHPKNYKNQPGLDFINRVKAEWDDTKVLQGEPGEYIVMARQSGKLWFIGGMTNSFERNVTISTSFLPDGKYKVNLWKDDPTGKKVLIDEVLKINRGEEISLYLASGGGFTAIFEKQ